MSQHSTQNRGRSPIFGQSTISQPSPLPIQLQQLGNSAGKQLPTQQSNVVTSHQPPTKINTNFTFSAMHVPLVRCHYHPDQQIRNFCLSPACLMPLCPACVAIHQLEHERLGTIGRFETLENCLTLTYQDVASECNRFVDDLYDVQRLLNDIKNTKQIHQQQIAESKQKLYQVIDAFFEALEQDQQQILFNETYKAQQSISTRWEALVRLLEKLNTDKCLKSLIKYHSKEIQDQCAHYHNETMQHVERQRSQLPSIVFDQSVLYQINQSLQRLIYWNNATPQPQPQPQPAPQHIQHQHQPQPLQQIPMNIQQVPKIRPTQQPYQVSPPHNNQNVPIQPGFKPLAQSVPHNLPGQVIPLNKTQQPNYYYPYQGAHYQLPQQQHQPQQCKPLQQYKDPYSLPGNPFLQNMPIHNLSPGSPSPRLDLSFSPKLDI